jgi:hypothetical protein
MIPHAAVRTKLGRPKWTGVRNSTEVRTSVGGHLLPTPVEAPKHKGTVAGIRRILKCIWESLRRPGAKNQRQESLVPLPRAAA